MKPKEITPDLKQRYAWKKVEAPKVWRPKHNGEELVGYFTGKTSKNGQFGQYDVILVAVPTRGVFMISGTRVVQLVDAANMQIGWPVRVVFKGRVALGEEREMKDFDVFVAEGDPLTEDEMPKIVGDDAAAES
jgi:hypothetical protein